MSSYSHNASKLLSRWQDRFNRRFSPSLWLCRTDGLALVLQRGTAGEWVLSRAMCAYFVLDCAEIPPGRRKQFVATTVARRAPFADPGYHVEFAGAKAMVWMWPQQRVLDAAGADAARPRRMVPETLHRGGPPEGCASELVGLAEGVEGRVWRDGLLAASEWWPAVPDAGTWAGFARGAGLAATAVPAVAQPPLSVQAWAAPGGGASLKDIGQRYRSLAIAVAACVLAAVVAFPLGSVIRLKAQEAAVNRTMASLDEGLQQIVAARETAERDALEVEQLLALRPPASQLDLLAAVAGLMPGTDWQLLEWRLHDPRHLEAVLKLERPDPEALVAAWEADGRFSEVTAELGRTPGELTMRATIERSRAH